MDYFESNFKDRPEDTPNDLPNGFEWESMKDGIEAKMDAQRPARSNRWWPLLLLLLIGGCGGWFAISYSGTEEAIAKEENTVSEKVSDTPDKQVINNIDKTPTENKTAKKINPSKNISTGNNSNIDNHQKADDPLNAVSPVFDPVIAETTIRSAQKSVGNQSSDNSERAKVLPTLNTPEETVETPVEKIERENTRELAFLATLLQPLSNDKDPALKTAIQVLKNQTQAAEAFSFTLLGGTNNWANNINPDRNAPFVAGFPGLSIRPEVSLQKNKWTFSLAYQFDQLQEEFAYDGSTTLQEERQNVEVGQVVNSLTGEIIERVNKDTVINVTYKQRELKYNTYNFHQLAFNIGRQLFISNRHELSATGGLRYLLLFNAEGKRLNEQNLVDEFSLKQSFGTSSRFAVSLGVQYAFRVNDKFSLLARLSGQQYLNSIDIGMNETIRPLIYGAQIGVQRRF